MRESSNIKHYENGFLVSSIITGVLVILFWGEYLNFINIERYSEILSVLNLLGLFCVGNIIKVIVDLKENNIGVNLEKILKLWGILIGFILINGIMIYFSKNSNNVYLMVMSRFLIYTTFIAASCLFYKRLYQMDRRTQWRMSQGIERRTNTFHWRYKFNYGKSRYEYKYFDIMKRINISRIVWAVVLVSIVFSRSEVDIRGRVGFTIFIIIIASLEQIESIFKWVFNIQGQCTGYYEKKLRNGRPYKYIYIITNFENKVEVKLKSKEFLRIDVGDDVSLDFALLTKSIVTKGV